jgi:hypothetical protein
MNETQNTAILADLEAVHQHLVAVFQDAGFDEFFNHSSLSVKPEGIAFPVLSLEAAVTVANRLTCLMPKREFTKQSDHCDTGSEFRMASRSPLDGVLQEHHVLPIGYIQSMVKVSQ